MSAAELPEREAARAGAGERVKDPYYPKDGNPGYDVKRYFVRLNYRPDSDPPFTATTRVTAVAEERLRRFHLDLGRTRIFSVTVNGRTADVVHRGAHELVVTPARRIRAGDRFVTKVSYRGPARVGNPRIDSWHRNGDAALALGEPHSCTSWFPCNDHPTDKAKFRVDATVPRPLEAASIGRRLHTTARERPDGAHVRVFRWSLNEPTATYLTTLYIDDLTFRRRTLADGTRVVDAYGPGQKSAMRGEKQLPKVIRVLERRWGNYPARDAGGIFVNMDVGYALETYTRPVYGFGGPLWVIVHEIGHQWWGDNVTLERWRDICLNECLASYSEWIWKERNGADLDEMYRRGVRRKGYYLFDLPLYDMGAGNEFGSGVYTKGRYFVHALRHKVGNKQFFKAMRGIQREYAVGNLSMIGLRDELEARTGIPLRSFWRQWVIETGRPSRPNLFPGRLGEGQGPR